MAENVNFKRYNLAPGENTFASPASSNPQDARRLQSLIPSLSGELTREQSNPVFATFPSPPSGPIGFFHQFKRNDGHGEFSYHFFCASATTLYKTTGTAPSLVWTPVTAVGTLATFPSAVNIDNLMHLSDGVLSYCYDGSVWFKDGLEIPINPPAITVTVGSAGSNIIDVNRYYRTTYVDDTPGRTAHESSATAISVGTGAVTANGSVHVQQEPGTVTAVLGNPVILGVGTEFSQRHVGMKLYTSKSRIQLQGVIASVETNTHLTLAAPATFSDATSEYSILPLRATGWAIYASSSEEDKVGKRLTKVGLGGSSYDDTSGMVGTTSSIFTNIDAPLIDDPTNPSLVMDVFKNRIFRRREDFKSLFSFTGFEEIKAQQTGSPAESVPAADDNTMSPAQINEQSMPDQSTEIRKLIKHGDALYIGTEDDIIPFYGNSLANFAMSENDAFKVGMAGRRGAVSTPFGLVFFSYDKKLYLYPSQYNFGTDSTTALVELSRPKRLDFERIANLDTVYTVFYNFGRRNMLVFNYQSSDGTYHAWIFDFETKGWFELQRGCTAVHVFEVTPGNKVLVGAGSADNVTYVLDDVTGIYPVTGSYPAGTYRQLVDFGDPDSTFVIGQIEYEKSSEDMEVVVTVWLDPVDPENPGDGVEIPMGKKRIGANRFQGMIPIGPNGGGATCQRLLVEYLVPASPVNASLRGIAVYAEKLPVDPR